MLLRISMGENLRIRSDFQRLHYSPPLFFVSTRIFCPWSARFPGFSLATLAVTFAAASVIGAFQGKAGSLAS